MTTYHVFLFQHESVLSLISGWTELITHGKYFCPPNPSSRTGTRDLVGTRVKPPQLDEFFLRGDARYRAEDLMLLSFSFSEADITP